MFRMILEVRTVNSVLTSLPYRIQIVIIWVHHKRLLLASIIYLHRSPHFITLLVQEGSIPADHLWK